MIERLLIVGLGSIGSRHVRLARTVLPHVQIVALRHRKCDGMTEQGIDQCVTDLEQALRFKPQAAVIANPASLHVEVALPLARAGVHLLIEKPISSSVEGVAGLIEVCQTGGVVLMTGYNLRFFPSLQRFRELLRQKRVGRIFSVRAETGQYLPSWRPGSDYRQSVSAQASLGGGALLELSHEIDYLRWLFGEVEWVSSIQRRQSALETDVEDTAHLVLGFAPANGETPVIAALNIDFIRHDTTRLCTVIGETGSLRWNALEGSVELFEQGANAWQTLYSENPRQDDSYAMEWRHFLECITAGRAPMISGEDGLAVLRVVQAARDSSNRGTIVSVQQEDEVVESPLNTA